MMNLTQLPGLPDDTPIGTIALPRKHTRGKRGGKGHKKIGTAAPHQIADAHLKNAIAAGPDAVAKRMHLFNALSALKGRKTAAPTMPPAAPPMGAAPSGTQPGPTGAV